MSRGRMSFFKSSMTFIPAVLARRMRAACTAGIVPFPGRARPRASERQFMELAVNIPAQEPQPGQAQSSSSLSCAFVHSPRATRPTPSKTPIKSTDFFADLAGQHGPAADHDGGNVQTQGGHEHSGNDLVAVGDQHQSRRRDGPWP